MLIPTILTSDSVVVIRQGKEMATAIFIEKQDGM